MTDPNRALDVHLAEILTRTAGTTPAVDDQGGFWRQQARAVCEANIPLHFRTAVTDHPSVADWTRQFRTHTIGARSLLLLGPTGVGKTFQAFGALRAAVDQDRPVRWMATTAADMYASLRPGAVADPEYQLGLYRRVGILFIDDLGAARPTEWTEEITYRILDDRYARQGPIIATSNLTLAQFKDGLGDRITSRLAEMCTVVVLKGDDRRRTAQRSGA